MPEDRHSDLDPRLQHDQGQIDALVDKDSNDPKFQFML